MDRRRFLTLVAASGAVITVTGCGGGSNDAAPAPIPLKPQPSAFAAVTISNSLYLEQFQIGFYGAGMRAIENLDLVTERAIAAAGAVGSSNISLLNTDALEAGTCCTILHANGKYWTYSIISKTSASLTISPGLLHPVSVTSKIERTWFNEAHPGKFYMRQLAQRIASEIPPGFTGKIVCFGDSWVGGDVHAERESLVKQLKLELPNAVVVNKGVGGNSIPDLIARFEADVAAEKPAYVVINTGTNDAYNPASVSFPVAVQYFVRTFRKMIGNVEALGAKSIVLGIPALAERDVATGYSNWILNDRAKAYRDSFHADWGIR